MIQKSIVPLLLILAAFLECSAQKNIPQQGDTTTYWRVTTNDDNEFVGRVMGIEAGVMTLKTDKFGTVTIKMYDIKLMEEADPSRIIGTDYWAENFQSTRYFWMPNGFGLKPGEAYYQNVWILFNQFSVGITKNISLGAGTIPIFLFGADVAPLWITPKISLPVAKKFNIGAGVVYLHVFTGSRSDGSGGGGVAYGVFTFGTRDKNASLGIGYGFSGKDFSKRPVITFSTMTRLGPRGYFMTENYLFGVGGGGDAEALALLSLGGRRLIKRVGLDFGGFIPVVGGLDRLIVIPWLGVSVPLGNQAGDN